MVTRRDKGMETMETKRCRRQCVTSKRVDKAIALSSSRGVSYEILYERGCVWAHYLVVSSLHERNAGRGAIEGDGCAPREKSDCTVDMGATGPARPPSAQ